MVGAFALDLADKQGIGLVCTLDGCTLVDHMVEDTVVDMDTVQA